ncbi:sulfatase [Galbibacter sp. EGI 63066]|uniref:sulfatase family protein n=1 Tax=Galbibacter sp. EGI 63066 TaxID=2993559 RepID=UPI002248962B|nr:sulfatase [Galbibacter sp. EGI 63066]MCX2679295.1 sulfatase [Galbibacter sp. EGI 63066]
MKKFAYIILGMTLLIGIVSCKQKNTDDSVSSSLPAGQAGAVENKTRPNIIFIMADDHAIQAISAYGHEISKLAPTPNIDRIAQNGALLNRNYCTNSICGPSRAVILTGKHSHINGFRMNGERFDGSQQTFPKLLQKAGYNTSIVGKWHLHGYPQGFDHWDILNDQGNYYNPQFIRLRDTSLLDKKRIDTTAHWAAKLPDTLVEQGYATDLITDKAIAYMEKVKDSANPFMMMVHHKAPHRNWMPALRHANKYDSVQFPLPDTYFTDHKGSLGSKEQQQTIYKDMYEGHDLKMTVAKGSHKLAHNPWKTDFDRMTPEQRATWDKAYQGKNDAMHEANLSGRELAEWKGQRYLQEYLATIASVDEGVGRILDYLEENDLIENTIVVYTSDQGFYLGEKGWFDKRYMYEESFGMPALIQYPKSIDKGTVINALTQNLDFAETFLDYAQVDIPQDMQGKSLRPVLEGEASEEDFRDAIYYHYYDYPAFHMVKRQYGVRTLRYKLIHFYDDIDTWELYDLQEDPDEVNNLIDNPEYDTIEAQLRIKLDSLQKHYKVTDKEFVPVDKKRIERAYKTFDKLRGHTGTSYDPQIDKDSRP